VQDDANLEPVFAASVRLANASTGYDCTRETDMQGQTLFAPLANGTYNLSIEATDYDPYGGSVPVSGQSAKIINIHHAD